MLKFPGTRPSTLGVNDGQLAPVPSSPNCVSSQAPSDDAEHYIAPLSFGGSGAEAIAKAKGVVQAMERTEVITEEANYLYAEFTTKLMGYVDDVEFYADEAAKTLHVRSASRLGKSDLGLNRKRIEAIRAQFSA